MLSLPSHGVLLELNGIGIYLIGASGTGKSEIALQLIYQGACLICDDAPDLKMAEDKNQLSGHCPEGFFGLMHLHDLGLINVPELLGPASFKPSHTIDFIIELIAADDRLAVVTRQTPQQLLTPDYQNWKYHCWTIPGIRLHLYRNRNIPLIIRTAVLQFSSDKRMGTHKKEYQSSREMK